MEFDWKEVGIIFLAAIILGITFSFPITAETVFNYSLIFYFTLFFLVIIAVNVIAKKIMAYLLEANVKTKLWEVYFFGFRAKEHFNKPLPMIWVPLLFSFLTNGFLKWIPVLEFDVTPRVERVSRRHGLYRFSEMTEWHIALIAVVGIFANLLLAIIGYFGLATINPIFESFALWNIFYASWCLLPVSSLDGTKIFFGSRVLWFTMLIICAVFLGFALYP